ncbi:hypothetical protein BDV12DRAFT_194521 [Aspergillus spectabilis]
MCDPCRLQYSRIPSSVPQDLLDCPTEAHPVIIHATIKASIAQANQIVQRLKSHLTGLFGKPVPVSAVIRRAATNSTLVGKWHELTTSELPGVRPLGSKSPSKSTDKLPKHGFLFMPNTKRQFEYARQKADTKLSDFTALIDFPFSVTAGGEMEDVVTAALGKVEAEPAFNYPQGDKNFHRLKWFADTHQPTVNTATANANTVEPRAEGQGRGQASRRVDPWDRKNCWVRKKKR